MVKIVSVTLLLVLLNYSSCFITKELYEQIKKNKKLSEESAAYVMYQILCAVNYCHGMGIIHRDLKP